MTTCYFLCTYLKYPILIYDQNCIYRHAKHCCVLRRRADTGAFASGHSAAATDSGLISHFPFNHYDIVFRYALEQ